MKTKENKTIHELSQQDQSPYPILSPRGRKGQSGSPFKGVFGFTLVELIIVITILAILATIAFMSFQGYMKQSRDAVRVSDLASASKGLSIFFTKSGVYPEAENPVTITASGNTLSSQGTLGENVVRAINMNQVPLDPVDQTKYTYSTNGTKTKYQLMSYTENASIASIMTQSYAQDLTDRGIQMQGDGLGIVLNPDNSLPTTSSVEAYSGTETYKIVFDNDTVLEGSGNLVFSQIYNMRDDLLKNKELAKLDNALVGYWDMETLTGNLLRDWSKYENNGVGYSGIVVGNATTSMGKGTSFDASKGQFFEVQDSTSLDLDSSFTFSALIIPKVTDIYRHMDILAKKGESFWAEPFRFNMSYYTGGTFLNNATRYIVNNTRYESGTITPIAEGKVVHVPIVSRGSFNGTNYERNIFQQETPETPQYFVMVTYDSGKYNCYVNGKLLQSAIIDVRSLWNSTGSLLIGKRGNSGGQNYVNGTLDDIRIYNKALNHHEILVHSKLAGF